MTKDFSIQEAFTFGWETFKKNYGFFILVLIFSFAIIGGTRFAAYYTLKQSILLYFLLYLLSAFINTLVGMGIIKVALGFADGKKGEFSDLFSCYPLFFKYFVASLLYGLAIFVGVILLIVPGIIVAVMYQFYGYAIIDRRFGSLESLKRSGAITKGVKGKLFVFWMALLGLNLLGLLCFLVGVFVTGPVSLLAIAHTYRKLATLTENPPIPNVQG